MEHEHEAIYDRDGTQTAIVDQERAAATDGVRGSSAVTVTWVDDQERVRHWGFHDDADGGTLESFLVYALAHAWVDARSILNCTDAELSERLRALLDSGFRCAGR